MSAPGQNRKSSMRAYVFRCSLNNGHRQDTSACPFRANTGSREDFLNENIAKSDQEATVFISPDQKVRVEQYYKERKDEWRLLFQFWTFDADHRHGFLLNPGEGDDLAGYRAGFRFSPDSQWLVRMQKLGSGSQTLFLYKRKGSQFSPATEKPLGDLDWDYFFTTPTSKGMHRDPENPYGLDHAFVALVKGMEENYAWMGQHWPDSRYVVISPSFDMQGEDVPGPCIE